MNTLAELLESSLRTHAELVALEEGDRQCSYSEVNRRSGDIATELRRRGVGPGCLVGILLNRSTRYVEALFAVIRVGAAFLPLDPREPEDRLRHVLDEARPCVVMTDGSAKVDMSVNEGVYNLEGGKPNTRQRHQHSTAIQDSGFDESRVAYVLYTSGSTGRPKGVCNTEAGLLNRLLWTQSEFVLTTDDCVAQKTPHTFDVSVWEFLWPFLAGARLAIASMNQQFDPRYLVKFIGRHNVTVMHFVPSLLSHFLGSGLTEATASNVRSIRQVICSGEELVLSTFEQYLRYFDAPLANLYGPTEAAIDVTAFKTRRRQTAPVPIGRPIANANVFPVGSDLVKTDDGTEGELLITGTPVGLGYLNQPEETAYRFVELDNDALGARGFRTGDLGYVDDRGDLVFVRRLDDQLKVRGVRIEPGEIESTITRTCAGVYQSAVVAIGAGDRKRLVAFLSVDPSARPGPDEDELRRNLLRSLPLSHVPSVFSVIPELPLTKHGKLDRRRLADLAEEQYSTRRL